MLLLHVRHSLIVKVAAVRVGILEAQITGGQFKARPNDGEGDLKKAQQQQTGKKNRAKSTGVGNQCEVNGECGRSGFDSFASDCRIATWVRLFFVYENSG